jgi:hypothetical protein
MISGRYRRLTAYTSWKASSLHFSELHMSTLVLKSVASLSSGHYGNLCMYYPVFSVSLWSFILRLVFSVHCTIRPLNTYWYLVFFLPPNCYFLCPGWFSAILLNLLSIPSYSSKLPWCPPYYPDVRECIVLSGLDVLRDPEQAGSDVSPLASPACEDQASLTSLDSSQSESSAKKKKSKKSKVLISRLSPAFSFHLLSRDSPSKTLSIHVGQIISESSL